jgi:hypothetical protein
VDWEFASVAGGSGGRESRVERFGDLNDIDITHWNIDWAGDLKIQNDKKINWPELMCWSLDFTWASGESCLRLRMKISVGTDIKSH